MAVGTSISLPALIQGKLTAGVIGFVVGAVGFGGISYVWDRIRRRRLNVFGDLPERLPVRPILTLQVDECAEIVVDTVTKLLNKSVGPVERSTVDAATWRLKTVTSKCWWSAIGERIDVVIKAEAENRTSMNVASQPRLSSVVLDWGRNYENVKRIQLAVSGSIGESKVRVLGLVEQALEG